MKRIIILISAILSIAAAAAEAKDVDLRKYGAKGDGKTKVTEKLQKAIDDVSAAGGGRVTLSGGIFLTAPIELKSGVELYIDADATLLASPDLDDYPERENLKHCLTEGMPRFRNVSLIFADEAENIAISGRGTIDVNGKCFVHEKEDPNWKGWKYERNVAPEKSLARVVFFAGCKNVTVKDVTMTNQPAGWSYWINDCDYVIFDRCHIYADVHYPNNDGIHINASRDVTVSNCIIETGDDSIIVRANCRTLKENKPCERVVITNCTLKSWSAAIRIGWTNDGVIRNCTFSNLSIVDSSTGISIYFPSMGKKNDHGREASLVENLIFSNIVMTEIYSYPIFVWIKQNDKVRIEAIRNCTFDNIRASGLSFPCIQGRPGNLIEDFSFNNCVFEKLEEGSLPGDRMHHGPAATTTLADRDYPKYFRNLVFNNTRFISVNN